MKVDPLLELLQKNAKLSHEELASLTNRGLEDVRAAIAAWEADGTIQGYHAIVDPEAAGDHDVTALIEVKLTPERGGGFDRLAARIAKFNQVRDCVLMSGGYDLAVTVKDRDLKEVARFVSEKLSTLEGVVSTVTHFQLKPYKMNGFYFGDEGSPDRLPVTP
ncbi:MAG: Lrp/AsnC family transcriptional regulator [Verrucomicrobiota bacterium]